MGDDALRRKIKEIQALSVKSCDKALAELDEIINQGIESGVVWMLKASIHFQRDEYPLAAKAFLKVIQRKPKSEDASLGLFHSLWSGGETDAAFEEMKRYFKEVGLDSKSQTAQDYWSIVKEINES